jgi:threonine efflux protein
MDLLRTLVPLAVALILIELLPGPSLIAVAAASIRDRSSGLWTALGVATGDMLWATAALGGIGTLLQQSRSTFLVLRCLGAGYLMMLALRLWRQDAPTAARRAARTHEPRGRSFANGLLVDLANPKAALLFTSLYASALPAGSDAWWAGAVLLTTSAVAYGWHLLVAVLLSGRRTRRCHLPARTSRAVNRLAAAVIGALGVRLALSM